MSKIPWVAEELLAADECFMSMDFTLREESPVPTEQDAECPRNLSGRFEELLTF
jgi:hypothetical protein